MSELISIAEIELTRIEWNKLRDESDFADYIPSVIQKLLNSQSPEEATGLYFDIENYVFVSGQLYEATEYLVPVLMASLLEVDKDFIKATILELLFWIVSGIPAQSEIASGNSELGERCRAKAREGLWILYRELFGKNSEAVLEVLEKIETDSSRLETFLKAKKTNLAELELERVDWSKLRDIRSCLKERIISSAYVPSVMKGILNAKSLEEAEKFYWQIENKAFVQGQLFESAEYLVPVLISSLLEVKEDFIKIWILEMLFQIVAGVPDQSEIALGNSELGERCRARAREGLWILYKILTNGNSENSGIASDILEIIETDSSRLEMFLKSIKV